MSGITNMTTTSATTLNAEMTTNIRNCYNNMATVRHLITLRGSEGDRSQSRPTLYVVVVIAVVSDIVNVVVAIFAIDFCRIVVASPNDGFVAVFVEENHFKGNKTHKIIQQTHILTEDVPNKFAVFTEHLVFTPFLWKYYPGSQLLTEICVFF